MTESKIWYFDKPGKDNFDNVLMIASKAAIDHKIKKVIIFSSTKESIIKLREAIDPNDDVSVIATTFACGRKFRNPQEDNENKYLIAETSHRDIGEYFRNMGIPLIQGGLPLEPIRSCTGDNGLEMISSTLGLISKGLELCVNSIIMAFENGYIDENEQVIAIAADTAIIATGSTKIDLFSPENGLRIEQILCMPY